MTEVYAVSDVHGHLDKLTRALTEAGLVDEHGDWAGRDARLWFLGDFLDRGPDGVGVIDLVRRLTEQSAGEVRALLGNHEILALGMRLFGTTEIPHDGIVPRTFERSWALNGGMDSDQQRLTDEHVEWLIDLPMVALDGDHLLIHSDNTEYFAWGQSIDAINTAARADLHNPDLEVWWEIWRRMTSRYAFRGKTGPAVAAEVLRRLGGRRLVHGHSIIADLAGVDPSALTRPVLYADGLALGIDAGAYDNGPCLVAKLT